MTKSNKDDTSNVFELPVASGGSTPLEVSRALVDYIKDKPRSRVIAIVMDPDDSSITMGWSQMDSGDMALMLNYSMFRWQNATFKED